MSSIYIVSSGKGIYDSRAEIILGAFTDNGAAVRCADNYRDKVSALRGKYTEEQQEEYHRDIDLLLEDRTDSEEWPVHLLDFWDWYYKNKLLDFWTSANIEEYPVNETIFKLPE